MSLLVSLLILSAAPVDVSALTERVDELRALANAHDAQLHKKGKPLLAELTEAAKLNDSAEVLVLLGRTQEYLDDWAGAALTLDQAVKRGPKSASAHFFLAIALQETNELEKAERHLVEATKLDPTRRSGWVELGRTRLALDKNELAVAALQRALTTGEPDAYCESMLGMALMRLKRGGEAIIHLERAVSLDPSDVLAAYNAGQHHQNVDQPTKALPFFELVAKSDPNDWHVRAKLVQMHQALGQAPERDARRREVLALHAAGKIESKHKDFCREQWSMKGVRVMAFESFTLEDPRAVRYTFRIARGETLERVLSLGSYQFTTDYMRGSGQLKPTERAWHLDGYGLDSSHLTYGIFNAEPTWEQTRQMVVDVLNDRLKPSSGTTTRTTVEKRKQP